MNERRGAGVAQGLQQQDAHPVPKDGGQGLRRRALSRLVESEPHGQDGGFQPVVGVKQGGAQVIQHGHWRERNPRKRRRRNRQQLHLRGKHKKAARQMITDEVVEALLRKRAKKERVWEDGEAPLRESGERRQ